MNSSVSNSEKKHFLKWLTSRYVLKRREALWILEYLFSHNLMLEKTHFVEDVASTPRGIYMSVTGSDKPDFRFYKNGHTFEDGMQAFHEVRLNWSSPLYIEIDFEDAWQHTEYLAILEDNPYASWNDSISKELTHTVEEALNYETLALARDQLMLEIDQALIDGDEETFMNRTEDLKRIDHQISESLLGNNQQIEE